MTKEFKDECDGSPIRVMKVIMTSDSSEGRRITGKEKRSTEKKISNLIKRWKCANSHF